MLVGSRLLKLTFILLFSLKSLLEGHLNNQKVRPNFEQKSVQRTFDQSKLRPNFDQKCVNRTFDQSKIQPNFYQKSVQETFGE